VKKDLHTVEVKQETPWGKRREPLKRPLKRCPRPRQIPSFFEGEGPSKMCFPGERGTKTFPEKKKRSKGGGGGGNHMDQKSTSSQKLPSRQKSTYRNDNHRGPQGHAGFKEGETRSHRQGGAAGKSSGTVDNPKKEVGGSTTGKAPHRDTKPERKRVTGLTKFCGEGTDASARK